MGGGTQGAFIPIDIDYAISEHAESRSLTLRVHGLADGRLADLVGRSLARRRRAGFANWIATNPVRIGLSALVDLAWTIGMFATHIAVCIVCGVCVVSIWSFRSWGADRQGGMRVLFVRQRTAW